jgi:hypothetical protein
LAGSIIAVSEDEAGMLLMLSYLFKDSVKIKLFNLSIGLIIGLSLFITGV